MAAFAIDVRRFFHGFALRAAILLAGRNWTGTVGMGAGFVAHSFFRSFSKFFGSRE
jgi:hypothetical protein